MGLKLNSRVMVRQWVEKRYLEIAVFNLIMIGLYLLRSAGYFDPYFVLSVNFIVMVGLVISVPLLGARSRAFFVISFLFWFVAGCFRILGVNVWAERTAIYTYQSLIIGTVLLIVESLIGKNSDG